jgi:hypothetical protein
MKRIIWCFFAMLMFIGFSFFECGDEQDDGQEEWTTSVNGASIYLSFSNYSEPRFWTGITNLKEGFILAGFTNGTYTYYKQEGDSLYVQYVIKDNDTLVMDADMSPEWIMKKIGESKMEMHYIGALPTEGYAVTQYMFSREYNN